MMIVLLTACLFLHTAIPVQGQSKCYTMSDCRQEDCTMREVAVCGSDNVCHCKKDFDVVVSRVSEVKDACHAVLCHNGGTCHVDADGEAWCKCAVGYGGQFCDSGISCDSMYDCDRRCGRPNTVCEDGICNCDGNGVPADDMYGPKTKSEGSNCTINKECHGICKAPKQGLCKVPEFVCACQDRGDMPCKTNSQCHMRCESGVGMCGPDNHCICDENNFQMVYNWKNEEDEKLTNLKNEIKNILNGFAANPKQNPRPQIKKCQTTADCHKACAGINNRLYVCASGVCYC